MKNLFKYHYFACIPYIVLIVNCGQLNYDPLHRGSPTAKEQMLSDDAVGRSPSAGFVGFGVFPWEAYPQGLDENQLQQVRDMGGSWIGLSIGMSESYTLKDRIIERNCHAGLSTIITIHGSNHQCSTAPSCLGGNCTGKWSDYPPKASCRQDWQDAVVRIVKHFSSDIPTCKVKYFKIWHELTDKWEVNFDQELLEERQSAAPAPYQCDQGNNAWPAHCTGSCQNWKVRCEMYKYSKILRTAYNGVRTLKSAGSIPQDVQILSASSGPNKYDGWEGLADAYTYWFLHGQDSLGKHTCDFYDALDVHWYERSQSVDKTENNVHWVKDKFIRSLDEYQSSRGRNCKTKGLFQTETGASKDDEYALDIHPNTESSQLCNRIFLGPGERAAAKDTAFKLLNIPEDYRNLKVKGLGHIFFTGWHMPWFTNTEHQCQLSLIFSYRPSLSYCAHMKAVTGSVEANPWCQLYGDMSLADSFYHAAEVSGNGGETSNLSLDDGVLKQKMKVHRDATYVDFTFDDKSAKFLNGQNSIIYPIDSNSFHGESGSIEMYVKTDWQFSPGVQGEHRYIFDIQPGRQWDDPGHMYLYFHKSSSLNFVVIDNNRQANGVNISLADISVEAGAQPWKKNQWHHVAVSWDFVGHRKRISLYIDGQLVGNAAEILSGQAMAVGPDSSHIVLGSNYSGGNVLQGNIDEFKVYAKSRPYLDSNKRTFIYRCGKEEWDYRECSSTGGCHWKTACNAEESALSCPNDCEAH